MLHNVQEKPYLYYYFNHSIHCQQLYPLLDAHYHNPFIGTQVLFRHRSTVARFSIMTFVKFHLSSSPSMNTTHFNSFVLITRGYREKKIDKKGIFL